MNRILILGARGRLGFAAAQAFLDGGWSVLGLARPGASLPVPKRDGMRGSMQWLQAGLDEHDRIVDASQGVSLVLHALNPNTYTHRAWQREAMPMLESSLRIASALGAGLMMPGNVYNFGSSLPARILESAQQSPTDPMGEIRVAMERRLQEESGRSIPQGIVIRAGDFFGSGTGTLLDLMIAKDIRRGRIRWPGPDDVATPWAYLPDLGETFRRVADARDRLGAFTSLHFAGHQKTGAQWREALSELAMEQGWLRQSGSGDASGDASIYASGDASVDASGARRRPMLDRATIPWRLFGLFAWAVPLVQSLVWRRYVWATPHALDNSALRALIGDEPRTPFADAARASIEQMNPVAASAQARTGVAAA